MNDFLLSICLPTYNRSKYIKRQLAFFLRDAAEFIGKEVDLLVSDNASPDDTDKIIREIYDNNKGMFFYKEQERNIGLDQWVFLVGQAKGKYVWIVGDDDLLRPGIVARVIKILKDHNDKDLGGVFLGFKFAALGDDNDFADWDAFDNDMANATLPKEGLHLYTPDDSRYFECSTNLNPRYGVMSFITRNVLLRHEVERIMNVGMFHHAAPIVWAMASIHNRYFYVDNKITIYGREVRKSEDPKSFVEHVACSHLEAYFDLEKYGFSKQEVHSMAEVFFEKGSAWALPFTREYFYADIIYKLLKIVISHGYFPLFAKVFLRRQYRRTLRTIKKKLWKD
jgi:glycosyltransferase involved in cell wall biosynthesis